MVLRPVSAGRDHPLAMATASATKATSLRRWRWNHLDGPSSPTNSQLVQQGRIELRAERGIASFLNLCDGYRR